MGMAAGLTGELFATQRRSSARDDAAPGLGLRGGQGARCQVGQAMLAQRIGQGGHEPLGSDALQLGQACQEIEWIDVFGCSKLRADQVQIARRGADVAVTEQAADGVQVDAPSSKWVAKQWRRVWVPPCLTIPAQWRDAW